MMLPCGVTGFWEEREPPPPNTDARQFRADCHHAARQLGGKVLRTELPYGRGTNNFGVAEIELPYQEAVAVLLNAHHPILAMADALGEHEQKLRFADCPMLAAEFRKLSHYRVLELTEVKERLTNGVIAELSTAELEQFNYWRPKTVGEVVFNFWD